MPYIYPEIKNFQGLFLQANSFTVPDGAMEQAENVVVKNDDEVQKTRGVYNYYTPLTGVLNRLFFYKSKLIGLFRTKVSYFTDTGSSPNETGVIHDLSGVTVSVSGISRSVEANNNLYFTSDNGILKIEDFDSAVFNSGVPQGLDLSLLILPSSIGPIASGKTVGYRVLFGRRDDNDNLLLSAPSSISLISVPAAEPGPSPNPTVPYTSTGSGPYTVTVTKAGHGLNNNDEIVVSDATDADADGTHIITVTSTSTFTFTTVGDPASGTLHYDYTRQIRIEASIPSEIVNVSDEYFVQIYRTSQVTTPVEPDLDYQLIAERQLTSTELTEHVLFFTDDVPDILLGAELYTNPNSREGELQSNYRAPNSQDVTFYKNYVFYGNCQTRALLNLNLVDTSDMANGQFLNVKVGSAVRRYVAHDGVGNQTVASRSITNDAGDLRIDYLVNGFNNGDSVLITNIVGGTLVTGTYFVVSVGTNTFKISLTFGGSAIAYNGETALDLQGTISPSSTAGLAWTRTSNVVTVTSASHGLISGMTLAITASSGGTPNVALANYLITVTGANTFTFAETAANSSGTLSYRQNNYMFYFDKTSSSIAVQLRSTAQAIIKAINRDPASLIYANYISTNVPGQMLFQGKDFTGQISMAASVALLGNEFLPILPTDFTTGSQVTSGSTSEINVFYTSKLSEPEAVPIVNRFPVGSGSKNIQRIIALRDSVIIIKEDGIFRLTGDTPETFLITVLDNTVFCVAKSSVQLLNNEVIFLSNQGVCRVSENAVQIVSRRIDDVIQPILGKATLEAETSAVSYESERLYYLTTLTPNSDATDVTWIFNVVNGIWTSCTNFIYQGIIGPSNSFYYIDLSNNIMKERKTQTKIDYCGQNTTVTVNSVSADKLTANISSVSVPTADDVIVKNNVFNRIKSVALNGIDFDVVFYNRGNLVAADTPILYAGYTSTIKFAPFHAGAVGRFKQFSQFQVHPRDESISKLEVFFSGYMFGSSSTIVWNINDILGNNASGWGFEPWGLFGWGDEDGIDLVIGTRPNVPIRIYVPIQQQRTTYIQPVLIHTSAGESINLQAITFSVRAYNERITR